MRSPIIVGLPVALLLIGTAPAKSAAETVALAMVAEGNISPPVQAFSEIESSALLQLEGGASLTFVHYEKCTMVSVTGGEVKLTPSRYAVRGGKITKERKVTCPRPVQLAEGGNLMSATMIMRSTPKIIPATPRFIVAGEGAEKVVNVKIKLDDEVVARLPIVAKATAWPSSVPALADGQTYEVSGEGDKGQDLFLMRFTVNGLTPSDPDKMLVVLRFN